MTAFDCVLFVSDSDFITFVHERLETILPCNILLLLPYHLITICARKVSLPAMRRRDRGSIPHGENMRVLKIHFKIRIRG